MTGLYIVAALIVMNVLTFALYGADKRRAKEHRWRISEYTLLLCALLYGSLGALLGMSVFRHKTKHRQFTLLVPIFFVLQLLLAILYFPKI